MEEPNWRPIRPLTLTSSVAQVLWQSRYISDIDSVPIQHLHLMLICKAFPLYEGRSDPGADRCFSPTLPRQVGVLEAECVVSISCLPLFPHGRYGREERGEDYCIKASGPSTKGVDNDITQPWSRLRGQGDPSGNDSRMRSRAERP